MFPSLTFTFTAFKECDCLLTTHKPCSCIEFAVSEPESSLPHRHGFLASPLIHYTLQPNPGAEGDKNKPSQKLTLAFATADGAVTGWRLSKICDRLRDGDLLPQRVLI